MNNLTGSMKDVAFATSPREFDLPYSTTLEEIMQKLLSLIHICHPTGNLEAE